MSGPGWVLWAHDLFDRETPPSREAEGADLARGFEALWHHTLDEGFLDDGRPTFTTFHLAVPGRAHVALPRDPLENPGWRALRRLRETPGLVEGLAALHLRRPDGDATPLVAAAVDAPDASTLWARLGGD